jgi:hypothetical protein
LVAKFQERMLGSQLPCFPLLYPSVFVVKANFGLWHTVAPSVPEAEEVAKVQEVEDGGGIVHVVKIHWGTSVSLVLGCEMAGLGLQYLLEDMVATPFDSDEATR